MPFMVMMASAKMYMATAINLSVTVIGKPITDTTNVKYGMVIDFGDLKKIVKEEIVDVFDHATVFNKNTPHVELGQRTGRSEVTMYYWLIISHK